MALVHVNTSTRTTSSILFQMSAGIPSTAVQIYNGHSAAIFLGDTTVTTTGATIGNSIAAGGSVQIWLKANDIVYAVSAAASAAGAISVLYSA